MWSRERDETKMSLMRCVYVLQIHPIRARQKVALVNPHQGWISQLVSPSGGRRRRANCSRLHQRHRGGGPPIRSNIVSSAANITASSGSTPYNARWDVSGAAGSPNEDKSHPKWRPNLFPAPPLSLSVYSSPSLAVFPTRGSLSTLRESIWQQRHFYIFLRARDWDKWGLRIETTVLIDRRIFNRTYI